MIEFQQGNTICSAGEELSHVSFITKGSVSVPLGGRTFQFGQGDIIGLADLKTGIYSSTYTASTDVTVFMHPYSDLSTLESLLRDNPDTAQLTVNSVCRQLAELLQYRALLKKEADSAYAVIRDSYSQYEHLSKKFALTSKKLPILDELIPASDNDPVEDWVQAYYLEIKGLEPEMLKGFFYRKPGISTGFFHRGMEDIVHILDSFDFYKEYLQNITKVFIDPSGVDLLSLISELHFDAINIKGADETIEAIVSRMIGLMSKMTYIEPAYFKERLGVYKNNLTAKRSNKEIVEAPTSEGVKQNLADSMNVILEYSECPEETCNKFSRFVYEFAGSSDKNGSEDTVYRLRKDLTVLFYEIYTQVLMKSIKDPAPPTIIKMFLNFGYVDADLAGHKNADYLYSIADALKGDEAMGVYTTMEWMMAIYQGKREPSRDDFDMDYVAYVREKKQGGKINAEEEQRLLNDLEAKLRFEIENVFPIANKVTFGRISTFCPLFSEHNVMRDLDVSMVTPAKLKDTFDELRKIDFSAYRRELSYTNEECGIPREYVHVELMPEIILMPNVGNRGSMWQEMEGRKRDTLPRAFLPIFLIEDLKKLIIRLTGEYRWEVIKRIQGPRWTDLSDPSLTSEYFNYLQFYRSNRDLSMDVKTTIKTELVRARNNYRSVFVANYMEWITYESNGSPRLNKFARRIMSEYCPFTAEIREKLALNPQYSELLKRYDVKMGQRNKHLENVIQKVTKLNKGVPKEILDEVEYLKT